MHKTIYCTPTLQNRHDKRHKKSRPPCRRAPKTSSPPLLECPCPPRFQQPMPSNSSLSSSSPPLTIGPPALPPPAPLVVECQRLPEPAAAGGHRPVDGRSAVSPGAVRPADSGRGAVRPPADGGVVAGVRVLPTGVQAAPGAALHGMHLRLGQLHHGAPPRAHRVRERGGSRHRVSCVLVGSSAGCCCVLVLVRV